jgi:predicted nucleic acid-binding protein
MKLIIDSNIVISTIISPDGVIANIIFNKLKGCDLLAPNYLFHEALEKQDKISKIAGYSTDEFLDLLHLITKRIDFIDETLITEKALRQAYDLTIDIDPKDTYYVALAIQSNTNIWTGDKKLIKGLRTKGFKYIIDTSELLEKIK